MTPQELTRAALDHITAHPEEWDQTLWCGTSKCFAGHVVVLAGGQMVEPRRPYLVWESGDELDDEVTPVWERARRLLELSVSDAMDLFQESNDLNDLYTLARRFGLLPDEVGAA